MNTETTRRTPTPTRRRAVRTGWVVLLACLALASASGLAEVIDDFNNGPK